MIEIRSLRDLLRLLFIFRRDFLWAFAATALIAVAGAFLLPTRFASEARLMIKPGRENLSAPIDASDRQTVVSQTSQRDPIVDEEKILTGRPVVDMATEHYLGQLADGGRPPGLWAGIKYQLKKAIEVAVTGMRRFAAMLGLVDTLEPKERLARQLVDRFEVTHSAGSSVMDVRFTWGDPLIAQQVLDTWLRSYMAERSRILGQGNLVPFYERKSAEATEHVDVLKKALQGRLEQIKSLSAEDSLNTLTDRLNSLHARQAEANGELSSLREGIAASQRSIATLPPETLTEREVGPNTAWLALQTQLAELKRQRVEALRTFTEKAPAVRAIDESLVVLEERARQETRDAPRLERRAANTISLTLQRGSAEKSVRMAELRSLLSSYEKEAGQLETERQSVMTAEPEIAQLQREVAAAEKNSSLYLANLEKARIDQALDENRISNVALVESPTFNATRVFPKNMALLLAALPGGLLVGLFVVYLRSMFDQRIHDGGLLESRLGVRLWSTVKAVRSPADVNSAFDASIYRVFSQLPLERLAQTGLTLALASARTGEGVHFVGEHLQAMLATEPVVLVTDPPAGRRAAPGELVLVLAPGLVDDRQVFARLRGADMVLLVVEARTSTLPVVQNALQIVASAYGKVDGVIVNRREFEVPVRVLRWLHL